MTPRPNIVFLLTDDQATATSVATAPARSARRASTASTGTPCASPITTSAPHAPPPAPAFSPATTATAPASGTPSAAARCCAPTSGPLADALTDAGYRTGHFGKWHLGDSPPYRPHERGFAESIYHAGGGIGNTGDPWGNDYFDDTYFKTASHPVRGLLHGRVCGGSAIFANRAERSTIV